MNYMYMYCGRALHGGVMSQVDHSPRYDPTSRYPLKYSNGYVADPNICRPPLAISLSL